MIVCGYNRSPDRLNEEAGSILVSALAILTVLLTTFFFIASYGMARYGHHIKNRNRIVATELSKAGINRALAQLNSNSSFSDPATVETPNGGRFTYSISSWGPYYLITSKGSYTNQTIQSTALLGSSPPDYFDAAITVCNETYPLVVAGNTRIYGDVNSGPLGISTGRIRGEGVTTKDYHTGKSIIHASLDVPTLNTSVINQYMHDVENRRLQTSSVINGSLILTSADTDLIQDKKLIIENNLSLNNLKFTTKTGITSLFVSGYVEVRGTSRISGMLEIIAEGVIRVKDSTHLDNVLLLSSDSIVFEDNASFSGIAISSRAISVKDNATVSYPSLLLLYGSDASLQEDRAVTLSSSNNIESLCFVSVDTTDADQSKSTLILDSLSNFTGYLISSGNTDVRGMVRGSIVAEQFHFYLAPTTYVNWIRDLYVVRDALDYTPAVPVLTSADSVDSYRIYRMETEM